MTNARFSNTCKSDFQILFGTSHSQEREEAQFLQVASEYNSVAAEMQKYQEVANKSYQNSSIVTHQEEEESENEEKEEDEEEFEEEEQDGEEENGGDSQAEEAHKNEEK